MRGRLKIISQLNTKGGGREVSKGGEWSATKSMHGSGNGFMEKGAGRSRSNQRLDVPKFLRYIKLLVNFNF